MVCEGVSEGVGIWRHAKRDSNSSEVPVHLHRGVSVKSLVLGNCTGDVIIDHLCQEDADFNLLVL